MSQHPSLRSVSKIVTKRNVLKRHERVDLLKSKKKWKEGDSVFGLPKTKKTE
ncbi:small basic protein [Chlamydiota bacterium]